MAHKILEVEQSQDLPFASWKIRKVGDVIQSISKDLGSGLLKSRSLKT